MFSTSVWRVPSGPLELLPIHFDRHSLAPVCPLTVEHDLMLHLFVSLLRWPEIRFKLVFAPCSSFPVNEKK